MATNSPPLSQLPTNNNESFNDAQNTQSVDTNNENLTSADLLNGNKLEINKDNDTIGGQSLKNNIRSNNSNASAVPSIDLNLMNKMSVINNLQAINASKINNENQNIMNNYNMNSLTNEKLNQLLMTVALNNNVDMNKLINNGDNNMNMNAMNFNNNTNSNMNENINYNNNNTSNNNTNNNNINNINLSNSILSQEFLIQLLQQQQQLQQQLQILQQQHQQLQQQHQLQENKEVKRDVNMMTSPKSNVNSFVQNNININPSPSYSSNNLRTKENTQEFYQYFSQMNDNSMSKMNTISMPSYALPVTSHPMSTSPFTASIPASYSLTPNLMPISPIGMSTSFNERNNDFINLGKQEFTKPPKIPSHLISSSLISSGIGNNNNNGNNDIDDNGDDKRKLKSSLSKGMSPLVATVAPMTVVNTNNDAMMNTNLELQENVDLTKENLDISKKKSLSNSSSTSLSSSTTLENDKNALLSSNDTGAAMPLTENSSTIKEDDSSKNSSTTSSNSTLALLPGGNNEADNEDNNDIKHSKVSNDSDANKESKGESSKANEGTSSVSTPKLINSNVESKTSDNNDLLSPENVREGMEALKLQDHQEIPSNMDSSANLGSTPNASSLNKYLSVISAAADSQKSSIVNSDDKTTELPILRIGQPISDLSGGGLMVNNGNINLNGISNSFSDGFDLLNFPSYRLNYMNNSNLSSNLSSFTNDGLLSLSNNHGNTSNNLSLNNSLNNGNDKKDLDFLSFSSSAATPSSLISNNKHLFPPSAAIPIYKNNKKLNINSNNNSSSMLNDGSFNGFFDNNMNSFDKILASSGSLRSDNKLLNSFSNKFGLYDNSVNSNNSIPVSTSSFSPIYNFAPTASLPININGVPIKGANANSRNMQQQQQHLSQISETPDLWELDMEPYFEQSSLSKDDGSWFSVDYKNSESHFPSSLNNAGGNNSFNSSLLSNNQSSIGNSVDLHNNNDNNSNSLDFQHLNYPFNINNMKQNNMNMMNQGTSSMNSSSIPSSVMDKNIWSSLLPSLINNNNMNTTNTINESISILQKTLAASNLANNNGNNNNNNSNENNNNSASLSPFIGFNDISVAQSNNLQLINQINELGNSINAQTSLLNANKSGLNINNNNNLHPSSAAVLSNNTSSKLSATLSKPINIRNPERRDFTSTSYNSRLIPNTPSSSFSSYFSTSPNSFFSMGGYSGANIPAAPNNSFNFGANFKSNNLNINSTATTTTANNNIESWTSTTKAVEPPLIEVPRTWYFSKDEAAKNSETIVLPKRFFKNEIPECYDNRDFMVMSYNILAPSYCTSEKFELTNPKYLDWEYRKKLILDEIAYYRADIICLQEVSPYDFNTWLFPQLQKLGYDGLYQPKKKKNSFDGCATFYCHSKFQLLIVQAFRYNDISLTEEKENTENKTNDKGDDSKEKTGENGSSNEEKNKKENENENNNNISNNNNNKNNKNSKYNQVTVNTTPDPSIFISSRKQNDSGSKIDLTKELLNVNPDLNVKDQESFIRDTTLRVKPFSNVALIAIFRNKFTNSRLRVVNTHFHWDPVYADTKLLQAAILMDWLSKSYQHPTVVCGDLNSKNGDPVMNYILNGKIDTGNFLGRNFGKFTKDKYLYHSNGLQESYQASDIPFTNRTPDFCGTIDHILYTNESLKLRNVLCGTVDQNRYLNDVESLPNKWFPSDHLLLLSAFRELREPHHRSRRDSFSYNNYSSSAPVRHTSYLNDQNYNHNRAAMNAKNKNNNNGNGNNFSYSNSYSTSNNNGSNNTSSNMMSSSYNPSHVYSNSIPNNARNSHYKGNSNIDFSNPNNNSYKQKSILSTSISSSLHSVNNSNANNNNNGNDAANKAKSGENNNGKKGSTTNTTSNESANSSKSTSSGGNSKSETFKKSSPILINNNGNHGHHHHYNGGHSYNSFKHQGNYFDKDYKKK